jgi:hypothetical protein
MSLGKKSKRQVATIRDAVFERDGGCVVHGSLWDMLKPCGGSLTIQHRVSRGMGGSAQYDSPEHLVTMCAIHNQLETSWPEFAKACIRCGWSIPRWLDDQGVRPSKVPVLHESGWYLLSGLARVHISAQVAEQTMTDFYGGDFDEKEN